MKRLYAWLQGMELGRADAKSCCACAAECWKPACAPRMRHDPVLLQRIRREKYDSHILQHLVEQYEGSCKELTETGGLRRTLRWTPITWTERLLVQLLYTGVNVLERTGLLRRYIVGGGKK